MSGNKRKQRQSRTWLGVSAVVNVPSARNDVIAQHPSVVDAASNLSNLPTRLRTF